jgi:hypothetical protein
MSAEAQWLNMHMRGDTPSIIDDAYPRGESPSGDVQSLIFYLTGVIR